MNKLSLFLIVLPLFQAASFGQEPPFPPERLPPVRLADIQPPLTLSQSDANIDSRQIRRLIGELTNVEEHFTLDYSVNTFNPEFHLLLGLEYDKHPNIFYPDPFRPYLKELVALGPNAIPLLLEHLDDESLTKTRLVATDRGRMTPNLWFHNELRGNPANWREKDMEFRLLLFQDDVSPKPQMGAYDVKVGDLCLDALGLIVGREYRSFARYSPKLGDIMICSPVHDDELCTQVREIWTSEDPRQMLFQSLLIDFASRGRFNGELLPGCVMAMEAQVTAATRLLYYYPQESTDLIVARLDGLDVSGDESDAEIVNDVYIYALVRAVAWCDDPRVREALDRLVSRVQDERFGLHLTNAIQAGSRQPKR
jgi:hypothetical protein